MARCGTDGAYRGGCRCDKCKHAHTVASRHVRARNVIARTRQSKSKLASVVEIPHSAPTELTSFEPGPVEQAVLRQIAESPNSGNHLAFEALSLNYARKIDSPEHRAQVHQLGRQMVDTLTKALSLEKPVKKSKGRLAQVISMTAKTRGKTG
jgi:hypothetical protein